MCPEGVRRLARVLLGAAGNEIVWGEESPSQGWTVGSMWGFAGMGYMCTENGQEDGQVVVGCSWKWGCRKEKPAPCQTVEHNVAFVWVTGAQQVDRGLWGAAGSGFRVRPSGKAGRERLCYVCSVQGALYGGCAIVGLGSGVTSPFGLSVSGIGMG